MTETPLNGCRSPEEIGSGGRGVPAEIRSVPLSSVGGVWTKVTSGGEYVFVLDNTFSIISGKAVDAGIYLSYRQPKYGRAEYR